MTQTTLIPDHSNSLMFPHYKVLLKLVTEIVVFCVVDFAVVLVKSLK